MTHLEQMLLKELEEREKKDKEIYKELLEVLENNNKAIQELQKQLVDMQKSLDILQGKK